MGYKELIRKADELKAVVDANRPLPKAALDSLRKAIAVELTYNSNAIEGNTLTLSETNIVVNDGLTIGGKTVREHLEAINHYEAVYWIESMKTFTERDLKDLHQLVLRGIEPSAGSYRNVGVFISGSLHLPPTPLQVPAEMEKLFQWYYEEKDKLHPIELAAVFHHKLVFIHPFIDGNGRTARLMMNLILFQAGYPFAIIEVGNRPRYIQALETASLTGNLEDFIEVVAESVVKGFDNYMYILGKPLPSKNMNLFGQ